MIIYHLITWTAVVFIAADKTWTIWPHHLPAIGISAFIIWAAGWAAIGRQVIPAWPTETDTNRRETEWTTDR